MIVPTRFPGLRIALVATAIWGVVWMSLEGDVTRVVLSAVVVTGLLLAVGFERWLGGRSLALSRWLSACFAAGLVWGGVSVLMALFLMALKTGLHAHGPEFTAAEIAWVWRQLPLWTAAGGLMGGAVGMLVAAFARD